MKTIFILLFISVLAMIVKGLVMGMFQFFGVVVGLVMVAMIFLATIFGGER